MEWVAISFSRRSSWPRDKTHVFFIGTWMHFTTETPGKLSDRITTSFYFYFILSVFCIEYVQLLY